MYTVELVTVGPDILKQIREGVPQFPTLMNTAFRRELRRIRRDLLDELLFIPPQPAHPFIWSFNQAAQERARRWWFWAIGAGIVPTENNRYKRSGKLPENWEVIYADSPDGGILSVENDAPGAQWVYGPRQVPSHALSGWPNADVAILEASEEAEARLIAIWHTVADPFAGVT